MSGGGQLETSVSSKHPSFVRGFCVHGPKLFPHSHRVDAQWERDAVCEIQSRGKPFAASKPTSFPLRFLLLLIKDFELLEVMSGVTYLHDFRIVHGDLKGVCPTSLVSLLLTDK